MCVALLVVGCKGEITLRGKSPFPDAPDAHCSQSKPGRVSARRLNNAEYGNTVRDLLHLGAAVDVSQQLPADSASLTAFDNDAALLDLSPERADAYLHAALAAVDAAWTSARSQLVTCDLASGGRACAEAALTALAPRAYRRPVTPDEVGSLLGVYDREKAGGASADDALKVSVEALLVSPRFLYLTNGVQDGVTRGVHRLNGYEVASRLSYFLWRSMPDEALFAAAANGQLATTSGLRAQVDRMLSLPGAALTSGFASQWLSLNKLPNIVVDATRYPGFTPEVRQDLGRETQALFDFVLSNKRPARELFTANYTFLNERLAAHYGVSGVTGEALQKMPVPVGQDRAGILGHAGIMMLSGGSSVRTSPVVRGHWVLAKILCESPPPPPPGIPPLGSTPGTSEGTLKQRLAAHRTQASCAACHTMMDPVGLGLESFDMVGKYRTQYEDGSPVDASGTLPSGVSFGNSRELLAAISTDKHAESCLTQYVLSYATGRTMSTADACTVQSVAGASFASGASLQDLVVNVVLSQPFQSNEQEVQ